MSFHGEATIVKPAAVLFDIGGTLLREEGYDLRAGVSSLYQVPQFRQAQGRRGEAEVAQELSRQIDEAHEFGGTEFTLSRWLESSIKDEDGFDLQELEMKLWHATAILTPMPYVEDALRELRDDQVRIGAVSNAIFSGETLRSELDKHRLLWAFDFVISSADSRMRKPDPRIFRQALARLGTDASTTWFVGDSWENDILGAVELGMPAIWLSSVDAPHDGVPHRRVANWQEFIRLFRSLREGGGRKKH